MIMRGFGHRWGLGELLVLGSAVGRWRGVVGFGDYGGFADFEASDPDLVVGQRETHDVVDEGFGFARSFRYAECVREEFLDEEQVRRGGEVGGEG